MPIVVGPGIEVGGGITIVVELLLTALFLAIEASFIEISFNSSNSFL